MATTDLVGTNPVVLDATNDEQAVRIGYTGDARHLRVSVTSTGTTTGLADVAAPVVLGNPAEA